MEPEFSTKPPKRTRPDTDYASCLICQKERAVSQFGPLQNLTDKGYPALLYAVTNRKDEVSFRLENELEPRHDFLKKNPVCHSKCRSKYTNRKTVDQKKSKFAKQEDSSAEAGCSTEPDRGAPITRSSTPQPINYKEECFICGRERTTKGDRSLLLVSTMDRQTSVWDKANELRDEDMLLKLRGSNNNCIDMVAGDFQYHKTCMNNYLTKRVPTQETCTHTSPYDAALTQLVSHIDEPLFRDDAVFFVTALRDEFRKYLESHGVENVESYRSQCLVARLQSHYEADGNCKIMVVPQKGCSSLICSADLSIGCMLAKLKQLKEKSEDAEYEEESEDEVTPDDTIISSYNTAKRIRMELQDQRKAEKQALKHAREAGTSSASGSQQIPESETEGMSLQMEVSYLEASRRVSCNLYNYLAWLITDAPPEVGEDGRVHVNPKQNEQVLNLAQDVCQAVAGIPTPKHIGTALHILKETRSKATVTLLNRFGNSISYQDAQRYITTMAKSAVEQTTQDGDVFIPTNLKAERFTQFAFDNLDFQEYTKDGRTLHGTTHIIFQYKDLEEDPTPVASVPLVKTRRSSLESPQPLHTKESHLSLKDRQRSRSLVGVETEPQLPACLAEPLNHLSILWHLVHACPIALLEDLKPSCTPPTWSSFQACLIPDASPATVIGYGPFFPQSPTHPDVVEQSVQYCMDVARNRDQEFTIITVDQAIYEVVLGLQKKNPQKYAKVILRMGGFHIGQNLMGAIGHLMQGTGIEDIMVEADVCLRGTANKIVSGKDYYAMLRAHSMVHAAMFTLHWEAFSRWLINEEKDLECISMLASNVQLLLDALSEKDVEKASSACADATDQLKEVSQLMAEFDQACTSPTTKLWLMYMDMVMILKRYIHAERAGLWEEHLAEVEKMLPYLVAAGHYKYVSCLPHYLEAMRGLPTLAPNIARAFKDGQFTVHQTEGRFNGVWTDMALEKTYNRDAKTKLFTGISQQPAAMEKYLQALPVLTAVSEQTRAMAHLDLDDRKHHEDSNTHAIKEAQTVKKIIDVVNNQMIDPFRCEEQELVNIATGHKAQSSDLVNAREKGLEALATAKNTGSEKVAPMKLATFAAKLKKPLSMALKAKKVYEEESVVVRNLYFVQDLDEDKKVDVFSHEWTSCPASLFEPDPSLDQGYAMRKGNKAEYLAAIKTSLGNSWREEDSLPSSDRPTVMVVDAMAFIQRHQHLGCITFRELQEKYLKQLIRSMPDNCDCIHFVGDRYDVPPAESLKGEEREKRKKSGPGKMKEYKPHDTLSIPEWKGFVHNPQNKANLLNYMGEAWAAQNKSLPTGRTLILGGIFHDPGRTILLSADCQIELPELSCEKHEEADTRMFAHIAYSVQYLHHKQAVVVATDTDVILMCMYYITHLDGLQELWVKKMDIYLPAHAIAEALAVKYDTEAANLTSMLLSTYILTGCDTVSYPYRRGKRRAFKVTVDHLADLLPLARYGDPEESLDVHEDVVTAARHYMLSLYDRSDFGGTLDALRAHLFGNIKGDMRCLPPTEDAFQLHLRRALHQLAVCKRAHLSEPTYPAATDFGRELASGKLVATMMLKEAKPTEFKRAKYCRCNKSKCARGCSCARANVKCVIACLCTGDPNKCSRVELTLEDSDSD